MPISYNQTRSPTTRNRSRTTTRSKTARTRTQTATAIRRRGATRVTQTRRNANRRGRPASTSTRATRTTKSTRRTRASTRATGTPTRRTATKTRRRVSRPRGAVTSDYDWSSMSGSDRTTRVRRSNRSTTRHKTSGAASTAGTTRRTRRATTGARSGRSDIGVEHNGRRVDRQRRRRDMRVGEQKPPTKSERVRNLFGVTPIVEDDGPNRFAARSRKRMNEDDAFDDDGNFRGDDVVADAPPSRGRCVDHNRRSRPDWLEDRDEERYDS